MRPLWGHSELVADFVAGMTFGRRFGPCEALGVIDQSGRLVGGLVFHNYQPEFGTIEISGASVDRRWLPRSVMHEIAAYVFGQLECQAIYTRNDPEARHIRRLWRAVGGVEHEIPRMRGRDKAEVLIVVTEEAWRSSKFAEVSDAGKTEPDANGHGRGAAGAGRAGAEGEQVPAHARSGEPARASPAYTSAGTGRRNGAASTGAATRRPAPDR